MPKATFFVAYAQFQPILLQYWQSGGQSPPACSAQVAIASGVELIEGNGDHDAAEEDRANGVRDAALAVRHRKPDDVPGNRERQDDNDGGHEYSVLERCTTVVQLVLIPLIGPLLGIFTPTRKNIFIRCHCAETLICRPS